MTVKIIDCSKAFPIYLNINATYTDIYPFPASILHMGLQHTKCRYVIHTALDKPPPIHHCTRVKVSIVGSLRDREVACSASDRQGSNFESCVWRTVSSQSSHHPQEVLLAEFSLYVHKGGLKPDSFHFIRINLRAHVCLVIMKSLCWYSPLFGSTLLWILYMYLLDANMLLPGYHVFI